MKIFYPTCILLTFVATSSLSQEGVIITIKDNKENPVPFTIYAPGVEEIYSDENGQLEITNEIRNDFAGKKLKIFFQDAIDRRFFEDAISNVSSPREIDKNTCALINGRKFTMENLISTMDYYAWQERHAFNSLFFGLPNCGEYCKLSNQLTQVVEKN